MKNYRKKSVQPMEPWTPETDMELVSVSEADKNNGSPKAGDMIAVNPNNVMDKWLIAQKFFEDNYEPATGIEQKDDQIKELRKRNEWLHHMMLTYLVEIQKCNKGLRRLNSQLKKSETNGMSGGRIAVEEIFDKSATEVDEGGY